MKKRFVKNRYKRKLVLSIFLVLFGVIGIGYANLSTNLSISGLLIVKKRPCEVNSLLYKVIQCEAEKNGLAKEYTGQHKDSYLEEPSQKIYYWNANNNSDGKAVANKNNVIFAGQCWNMIRTTDTGGVKLLYNGEVVNNSCLSNRGNHVGYGSDYTTTLSDSYYYGTSYTYANGSFRLAGTITTGIKKGQYTCKSTNTNYSCSTLYFVDRLDNDSSYYVYQVNSDIAYSAIGSSSYNNSGTSMSNAGYMYNHIYNDNVKTINFENVFFKSGYAGSTDFWYADSFVWGTPSSNVYSLVNPSQVTSTDDYPNLVGKYTFLSNSETYSSSMLRYIVGFSGRTLYYVELRSGNDINYYDDVFSYGDSYIDNGDGTYTINNAATMNRMSWFSNYSNMLDKFVCSDNASGTCSSLRHVLQTISDRYYYYLVGNTYKYGKNFIYDGGKYILNDGIITVDNIVTQNLSIFSNAHYTCWNDTGECSTISFIYDDEYTSDGRGLRYLNMSDGRSITDVLNEMLYNNDVNKYNSNVKTIVDTWYKQNMIGFTDYLEDTIYCNDRSSRDYLHSAFSLEGSIQNSYGFMGSADLLCPNETDQFSVNNNVAKLDYPVGMITYREEELFDNLNVLASGSAFWTMTPQYYHDGYTEIRYLYASGFSNYIKASSSAGIRPVVSLKSGTTFTSGDGSKANPYVIQ